MEPTVNYTTTDYVKNDEVESKLSGGAIAGIVIGCLAGVLLIVGLSLFIVKKKRENDDGMAGIEASYDIKVVDTGYVRLEDKDSAL